MLPSLLRPYTLFAATIACIGLLAFAVSAAGDVGRALSLTRILADSLGHLVVGLVGLWLLSERRPVVARLDRWVSGGEEA